MRFLHMADVHLDTPFAGRSRAMRDRLRDASREAFRRAVDLALDREVQAVLIAGDLLDGERLSFATERFLLDQVRRLETAGVQVIYSTGNHDPGQAGLRVHRIDWPANVTVVRSHRPRRVPVRDRTGTLLGRVTAAGHETDRESRDLAAEFPTPGDEIPEVALLHAQVLGSRASEGHDRYAPVELDRLRGAGYRYWALGHVHLRQALSREPAIHYPGNLQGRHPGEAGGKGCLLVELSSGGEADVEFVELAPIRWEEVAVGGLEEAGTLEAVEREVRVAWDALRNSHHAPSGCEWIVRVRLGGGSPLWRQLGVEEEREFLCQELCRALGALEVEVRVDAVHPVVDIDAHRARQDVVGEALRLLDEIRAGSASLPVTADSLVLSELSERRGELDEQVRRLLSGAEGRLLARLLSDASGAER